MQNSIRISLLIGAFMVVAGAGCAAEESFPVVSDVSELFERVYEVCQDSQTGDRIYVEIHSGDDSSWSFLYDRDGDLIEETPEAHVGEVRSTETQVGNCQRTTEEYFSSKVQR